MKKRVPFSSLLKTVNVSNDIETFSYDIHSITLNIVIRQLVIVSKIIVHKLVILDNPFYPPLRSYFSFHLHVFMIQYFHCFGRDFYV